MNKREKELVITRYEGAILALELITTTLNSSKGIEVSVDDNCARHLTADERLNHLEKTLRSFIKNLQGEIEKCQKK